MYSRNGGGRNLVGLRGSADDIGVYLAILDHSCQVAQEPRVTIGEAIADPPYQLHRVSGATVLSDGRIALVNQGSEELRFYDAEGTFLRAAGREGQGPGEFSNAFYRWRLPGDTLWVGDYNPWEYEVFAPSGEWLRQVRPHPTQANAPDGGGVLSDGRLLLGRHDRTNRSPDFTVTDSLHVLLYAPEGSLEDTLHVTPYGRWGQGSEDRVRVDHGDRGTGPSIRHGPREHAGAARLRRGLHAPARADHPLDRSGSDHHGRWVPTTCSDCRRGSSGSSRSHCTT